MAATRVAPPWKLWFLSVVGVPLLMVVGTALLSVAPLRMPDAFGLWFLPGLFALGAVGSVIASARLRTGILPRILLAAASIVLLSVLYFLALLALMIAGSQL